MNFIIQAWSAALPVDSVKFYFDGGSRGNPGPAAGAAFTAYDGGHERVCFLESATNNEAEYRGLLMAIELARSLDLAQVQFLGDSKLVVMQVTGEWQVKHPMMGELRLLVVKALAAFSHWTLEWIPREQNGEADRVANEEMDRRMGIEPKVSMEPIPINVALPAAGIPSAAAIATLNSLGNKAGFKDLLKLKVGGSDAFSRMSLTSLSTAIPNFIELEQAFAGRLNADSLTKELHEDARNKLLLNALRWSARGLQGDLPLRKVLADWELGQKMRGKSR